MPWSTITKPIVIASLTWLLAISGIAKGDSTQDKFHRAYYLEHEKGDFAGAAKLYEEVAAGGDSDLKGQAKDRLQSCREELAAADLAKLMPVHTLAYAELSNPGGQLRRLLDQLGLLAGKSQDAKLGEKGPRVAISPELIDGVLGARGAAVAITGIDPVKQVPTGVLVFHPGNLEVVRGLIETGLPIGGKSAEPINGYATYGIENEVYVTLTSRLVIASSEKSQIQGVLKRLSGEDKNSFATAEGMKDALANRESELLFVTVNAKALVPILKGMAVATGANSQDMAMAHAVIDIDSLRTLTARAGVNDAGLSIDLALQLDQGHHSLAFNLLRTPSVNPETVKRIPAGAAGFLVGALNESSSRFSANKSEKGNSKPPVTALDFGREVFANINSFAVFVLPPDSDGGGAKHQIPDVGALFNVNDVAKSEALWTQILGLVSLGAGGGNVEGTIEKIEGNDVRQFSLPEGHKAYFATAESDVYVASTKSAMTRALAARRNGKGIADDAVFAKSVARINASSVKGIFVHPGRCAEVAKPHMSENELAEIKPVLEVLTDTVVAITVDHSDQTLRVNGRVDGIPKIGGLVSAMIAQEQAGQQRSNEIRTAMQRKDFDAVIKNVNEDLEKKPEDRELLDAKFNALAVGKKDHEAALKVAEQILSVNDDDSNQLNIFAWTVLTESQYEGKYAEVAMRAALRSNELTKFKNWAFLDTLALAKFETGDVAGAIEFEKKAIALAKGAGQPDLNDALARFEAAKQEPKKVRVSQSTQAPG